MWNRGSWRLCSLALAGLLLSPLWVGAAAQQVVPAAGAMPVTLEDALRRAEDTSEQMTISRAGVLRARGQQLQARSQLFPQLAASLGYTRTLASEFSSVTSSSAAPDTTTAPTNCPSGRFTPDPGLPLAQRVDSLEHALECSSSSSPFAAFKNLPFGRKNQYNVGLSFSQNVFTGGRVTGQIAQAAAGRAVADIALAATRAQLMLDVTEAYYDAALADRLLAIAEGTLTQSRQTLEQVRLARQVGNQPEFELLRAQVAYENQQPAVIQRRAQRDIAFLRLKQLLNLPQATTIALTTSLGDSASSVHLTRLASNLVRNVGDTTTAVRAPVRQAAQALRAQEGVVRVARAERLPSVAIVSQYGRVAYPEGGLPDWNQFRTNWTVGVSMSVPLFTGGRISGDNMIAQAGLLEARARLQQTAELAALDTRSALAQLNAAEASYNASAGTAQQASRAYSIAQVRYQEGISTQLELSDSRLMVQQAEANRAQAARDLQVARIRMALLPDLPLGVGSSTSNAASAGQNGTGSQQMVPQQQATPQQQSPQQTQQRTGATAVSASSASVNQ